MKKRKKTHNNSDTSHELIWKSFVEELVPSFISEDTAEFSVAVNGRVYGFPHGMYCTLVYARVQLIVIISFR